jgi:hypothetical protein
LSGCLGGGGGGGGGGASNASTPGAPVISGSAPTAVKPNTAYAFKPSVSDPDGDAVSFEIQNKPAWATFNTVTGELTGTPSTEHLGKYEGIVISASDGKGRGQLSFSITVGEEAAGTGPTVTLAWTAPTANTDGSPLTDLSGYVITYGTSADALTQSVTVDNPSIDRYILDTLPPGTYFFAVRAISASGAESELSQVVTKAVG